MRTVYDILALAEGVEGIAVSSPGGLVTINQKLLTGKQLKWRRNASAFVQVISVWKVLHISYGLSVCNEHHSILPH